MAEVVESRYQAWVELAPIAVFAVDSTGRYVEANPAAVALLGFSLEELRERTVADVCDPADLQRALREFGALRAGSSLEAEYTLRHKNGSAVRVALRAVPTPEGVLVAFCQDVTAQREAEAALVESEARNDDLVRSMSDWAWEVDTEGRYTWVSDAVERLLGVPAHQVVGRTAFDFMPPAEAARVGPLFAAVVAARKPLVALANVALHRDGHEVHLETNGVPVFGPSGELRGYRGADRDVTERVVHLRELTQARDAAEAGTRAKSHFLATISHELRTPLNGVLGMAQLLELTTLDQEQRDYLGTLRSSADGLLKLIDDVLEYTRLEAGTVPSVPEPFDARELLAALAEQARPTAAPGVTVTVAVDPEVPPTLVADALHARRIVGHLVENAAKFTRAGQLTLRARPRERHGAAMLLEFSVQDTGIGIPPATLKRLFTPFSQGDSSTTRQFGGLGLGLTLCQRLAQLMDARLEAQSVLGEGSTFRLLLPVGVGPLLSTSPVPQAVAAGPLRVLLAEDNPINRRYAEAVLKKLGHRVEAVGDGLEALSALERAPWDVVLMDLQMPRCDGLTAVRRLRERETASGHAHQLVLAVTAWASADERDDYLARGFDGLVPKPFGINQLSAELALVKPHAPT